jgi:hypothetical protein
MMAIQPTARGVRVPQLPAASGAVCLTSDSVEDGAAEREKAAGAVPSTPEEAAKSGVACSMAEASADADGATSPEDRS